MPIRNGAPHPWLILSHVSRVFPEFAMDTRENFWKKRRRNIDSLVDEVEGGISAVDLFLGVVVLFGVFPFPQVFLI